MYSHHMQVYSIVAHKNSTHTLHYTDFSSVWGSSAAGHTPYTHCTHNTVLPQSECVCTHSTNTTSYTLYWIHDDSSDSFLCVCPLTTPLQRAYLPSLSWAYNTAPTSFSFFLHSVQSIYSGTLFSFHTHCTEYLLWNIIQFSYTLYRVFTPSDCLVHTTQHRRHSFLVPYCTEYCCLIDCVL